MIDRILAVSSISGLAVCAILFGFRFFGIVTPGSPEYSIVNFAFPWVGAVALVLGDFYVVRRQRPTTRSGFPALKWLYPTIIFFIILIGGAVYLIFMCVGMNFMGQ